MPLVSVIIPTYNRAALLKQAIESVLAAKQDDIELEIFVVDDGSTDETPAVVKNYPVIYLRQSGGLGAGGARNVGLAAAQGDYTAFLDDDDAWRNSASISSRRRQWGTRCVVRLPLSLILRRITRGAAQAVITVQVCVSSQPLLN